MRQLDSADAQMLFIDRPRTPNHVTALFVYGPRPDGSGLSYADVVATVAARLRGARAFREVVRRTPFDVDEPWWVTRADADVDVEFHVRELGMPRAGSWRAFFDLVARIHARPLDLARPPWEISLITGLDEIPGEPAGTAALLIKVHHAAVDRTAGLEIVTALHDLDRHAAVDLLLRGDSSHGARADPEPSSWDLLRRGLINDAHKPLHALRASIRTVPVAGRLPGEIRRRAPGGSAVRVPQTRFNTRVSPHRAIECRPFPFDRIRRARTLVAGASVHDVTLAIVAGGLRQYLRAKRELPATSLVALVPISTRVPDGRRGRLFTMVPAALHTDIADPVDRLAAIHADLSAADVFHGAVGARTLTDISTVLPGRLYGLVSRAESSLEAVLGARLRHNTVITSVPGSTQPLYFRGAPVRHAYGAGPIPDNTGLSHLITTHDHELTLNVTADRSMLPDPDFYGACLSASYDDLSGRITRRAPRAGQRSAST